MFDSLLAHLNESIKQHGGKPCRIPSDLARCSSKKSYGIIRNWLWELDGFRRWRVTSLDAGDKLQVLNSVAYPDYSRDQPLLGVDLLWFGKTSKLVAVLDFQPLFQDEKYFEKYYQDLKILKRRFPEMSNAKAMNAYDPKQYFSPWLLFCKGGVDQAKNILPIVFDDFLNSYWNLHNKQLMNSYDVKPYQIKNLHKEYDKYNYERDPAHGLFTSYFGKDWSERFLNQFLFPFALLD